MTYKIVLLLVVVLVSSFLISFLVWNLPNMGIGATAEVSKLNPTQDVMEVLNVEKCKDLVKSQAEWTLTNCKDNAVIHLVLKSSGGMWMKICGDWSDGRDAFLKAKDVLSALGVKTNCDADSIIFLRDEGGTTVYNVCGSELYLKDGCIV